MNVTVLAELGFLLSSLQSSMVYLKRQSGYYSNNKQNLSFSSRMCRIEHYTGQQQRLRYFDFVFVIETAKYWVAFRFFQDNNHSSVLLYKTLQPTNMLSFCCLLQQEVVEQMGCHGLRADTGRWENNVHLDRKTGCV